MRLSDLLGAEIRTESGERLGRLRDLRAGLTSRSLKVNGLCVGGWGFLDASGSAHRNRAGACTHTISFHGQPSSARTDAASSSATAPSRNRLRGLPLYLTESDIEGLLTPEEAVDAIEACFRRLAEGAVENMPRRRLRMPDGALAVMGAADAELDLAGSKTYLASGEGTTFVVSLFKPGETVAVIEADRLGQLRTGAASGVAARHLARPGARSLGVIGCGWQAESQVACIRAAFPPWNASSPTAGRPSGWPTSASEPEPSRARATQTPESRRSS